MFGRPIGGRGELGLPVLRIGMFGGAATMMDGRGAVGDAAGIGVALAGAASAGLAFTEAEPGIPGVTAGFATAGFSTTPSMDAGFADVFDFSAAEFVEDLATGALLLVTGEMVALLVGSLAGFRVTCGLSEGCCAEDLIVDFPTGFAMAG